MTGKLKRHRSNEESTRVSVKVCVGHHTVPTEKLNTGDEDVILLVLSYYAGVAAIKKALGYGSRTVLPQSNVLQQLKDAIVQTRPPQRRDMS